MAHDNRFVIVNLLVSVIVLLPVVTKHKKRVQSDTQL